MLQFCGQDRCLVDANGRVRLGPRFLADFRQNGGDVVLHCLPEGALGVYPEGTWQKMRQGEARPELQAARSVVQRRRLRRFGAMSQAERLTNQGRITVPPGYRELLELQPGIEAVLVGCEIGIEVWNKIRWQAEFRRLHEHELQKAEGEMRADLGSYSEPEI